MTGRCDTRRGGGSGREHRGAWRRIAAAAMLLAALGACRSAQQIRPDQPSSSVAVAAPAEQPFSVSLVPAVPVPIRIGALLGFNVSSDTAGYYSLYLIDPVDEVSVLAENLPLAAGSLEYPSPPAQDYRLRAAEPLGFNRVILLVTREPFVGFSGDTTLSTARSLAIRGPAFVSRLNGATDALAPSSWAVDEISVRIVG